MMKRAVLDYPDKRLDGIGAWVRVRDEGDKITLSYKQMADRTIKGTSEVMVVVDSFESTIKLL